MAMQFSVEVAWSPGDWTDESTRVRRVKTWAGFDRPDAAVAAVGRCTVELDNRDQRFSPGYAAGPLYGNLLPRREVEVRASDGVSTWTLFRGYIETIEPEAGDWAQTCNLTCVDGLALLQQQRVSVAHADSKAVDEAVADVVALAYTPPDDAYADNGDSLSHYGRAWQPEHTTALDALREIAQTVYGRFYVARDGTAVFQTRDARQDPSQAAAWEIGALPPTYADLVLETQAAHLLAYWRLNESSGTAVADSSGHGCTGTASGVTWGASGIGDGDTAASFDGVNDYVDVYSAALASAFDGAAGTLLVWAKLVAGAWTDGLNHYPAAFGADGNNAIYIRKYSTNNQFGVEYRAGGTVKTVILAGQTSTDWRQVVITWDKAADEMKAYIDGAQVGTTQTGLGTWAGALASNKAILSGSVVVYAVFYGDLAHAALWDVALTPAEVAALAVVP